MLLNKIKPPFARLAVFFMSFFLGALSSYALQSFSTLSGFKTLTAFRKRIFTSIWAREFG
jgi:hypothetical protein